MSTTMQLSDLMTAVRQRADMCPAGYTPSLNSTAYFVTDPELISYINQDYFELYDLLVQKYGDNYYVSTPYQFTADGTNDQFPLPSDCFKALGVDIQLNQGTSKWVRLQTFEMSARNRNSSPIFQPFGNYANIRYRLNGSNIWFDTIPPVNQIFRLLYVPRLTPLANLTDVMDGISGWTEYVIVSSTIKCRMKQEDDVSALFAVKDALTRRIEAAAENRNAGDPPRVSDSAGYGYGYGMPWQGF